MLVCDYIVNFFIDKGITDVFGYPGGMVTYLMDSLSKKQKEIKTHTNYHEQAAAFAACAYAQVKCIPGVAYATSGPGATNLITGIANAYFDSIPAIFITGQVNTYESKDSLKVRQRGFQETDIVAICSPITKYSIKIIDATKIAYELEKAYHYAMSGRKGPVLLDIPMNIQRTEINEDSLVHFKEIQINKIDYLKIADLILKKLNTCQKPMFLFGAGINRDFEIKKQVRNLLNKINLPVATSMIGIDIVSSSYRYNMGFIGAYGHRTANFCAMKSDLIIACGTRLDLRQVSANRKDFAPEASIIRIDIDNNELKYHIRDNDINIQCDVNELIKELNKISLEENKLHNDWRDYCNYLEKKLNNFDNEPANKVIAQLSELITDNTVITTDVGQNQVWVAQSFKVKENQRILFSGGHGAMGYSLPAAIGAYYASLKPIICFSGDGGLQMNIQELQFIKAYNIPVKIVLFNNHSLGMIRHFQEMYFNSNFSQTKENTGYSVPNFCKIAKAYGIRSIKISTKNEINKLKSILNDNESAFIEIRLSDTTYVFPKLAINKPINDQEPEMDRNLYSNLMNGI